MSHSPAYSALEPNVALLISVELLSLSKVNRIWPKDQLTELDVDVESCRLSENVGTWQLIPQYSRKCFGKVLVE